MEQTSDNLEELTIDQLKVIALKQRMGDMVADYEEKIADMRANITRNMEALHKQNESLLAELGRVKNELVKHETIKPEENQNADSTD